MNPIKAKEWDWDSDNPATDEFNRPIPYTYKDINGKRWNCRNCKGIYFRIQDSNTLACYACGRSMYSSNPEGFKLRRLVS